MASEIQVANRALSKLGAARITSLSDDVKAARAINSCFADLRDDELRAHRWQFTMKRTSLAALSTTPAFGFDYQYQLPSDFLKLDMVDDRFPDIAMDNYLTGEPTDWVLEGGLILANISAPLKVRYQAQITDPNSWDVNFREMLSCRIAAEVAEELTQSNEKRRLAWDEYKQSLVKAVRSGAIERPPVPLGDNTWIIGRI